LYFQPAVAILHGLYFDASHKLNAFDRRFPAPYVAGVGVPKEMSMENSFPVAHCTNPGCSAPFDEVEGKLYRFHDTRDAGDSAADAAGTLYYWLCAKCAQEYTLESAGEDSGTVLWLKCASGKAARNRS
jgi:hypothetical protein